MMDLFGNEIQEVQKKRTCDEILNDYDGFVEKFKPKKTTDDCYTPKPVYDAVVSWIRENADIEGKEIVRPFYPGGDYEHYDYPENCVVIDNPPFSIISKILRFYHERNILFFLFAPHLTLFSTKGITWTCIVCDVHIIYENGAKVKTSFASNLFGDIRIMTAPELYRRIAAAQGETRRRRLPRYQYPANVVTSALLGRIAHRVDFKVRSSECRQISKLDAQRGKAIFGRGFLISDRAAAERAAAERAAADREDITWKLSSGEKRIIEELG